MAMPSGNVAIPEKMPYPASGGGAGGEIHRHWFPDERDGFISWLRGEFAAANAMIDALCNHLRMVGEPGEYDAVIGSIQQRRCNWTPVLHMQQYFSIAEILYALQQAGWRRQQHHQHQHQHQQQRPFEHFKAGGKDLKRVNVLGGGPRQQGVQGQRVESAKEGVERVGDKIEVPKLGGEVAKPLARNVVPAEEKKDGPDDIAKRSLTMYAKKSESAQGTISSKSNLEGKEMSDGCTLNSKDTCLKSSESATGTISDNLNSEGKKESNGCILNSKESCHPVDHNLDTLPNEDVKMNPGSIPKTFVGTDLSDGKGVNVVDGLQLYEGLYNDLEVSKLVSLVNDLRAAGRKGLLQGQAFIVSKRPMKGHGREMIQLGIPVVDSPLEVENVVEISKDRRIEPIPSLLQDVIERMSSLQVMNDKPDSCVIDFYSEGDHSQPHTWPPWLGRPVCLLVLSDCDLTFGRVIVSDCPGDYRGSLKLSLTPGSLLLMQGKSTDIAKHAIPSLGKQRILVTFAKCLPKKYASRDGQRLPSSVVPPPHWAQSTSRLPNPIRHPAGSKHSATGVLPAPAIRPQLPSANGMQPLFMPAPVAAAMPFPAAVAIPPCSTGWPGAPPRHPPPRLPVPGTGVFLPPGSGNSSPPLQLTSAAEMSFPIETTPYIEKDSGLGKASTNSCASPKGKADGDVQRHGCNGSTNVTGDSRVTEEELLDVEIGASKQVTGSNLGSESDGQIN